MDGKVITGVAICLLSVFFFRPAGADDLEIMTATVLNANGLLCAKVVDINPLPVKKNIYEVTCIEYRGGSGKVRYIMDAGTGKAWRP